MYQSNNQQSCCDWFILGNDLAKVRLLLPALPCIMFQTTLACAKINFIFEKHTHLFVFCRFLRFSVVLIDNVGISCDGLNYTIEMMQRKRIIRTTIRTNERKIRKDAANRMTSESCIFDNFISTSRSHHPKNHHSWLE